MSIIYKYPLIWDRQDIAEVTVTGNLLHAGIDPRGITCVWVLVEKDSPDMQVTHRIALVGTGQELPEGRWAHLSTIKEGQLMAHFFVELT